MQTETTLKTSAHADAGRDAYFDLMIEMAGKHSAPSAAAKAQNKAVEQMIIDYYYKHGVEASKEFVEGYNMAVQNMG